MTYRYILLDEGKWVLGSRGFDSYAAAQEHTRTISASRRPRIFDEEMAHSASFDPRCQCVLCIAHGLLRGDRGDLAGLPSDVDADDFRAFLAALFDKMARSKGSGSAEAPTVALVQEMRDEALDFAGWGFWLWRRLRKLEHEVRILEDFQENSP